MAKMPDHFGALICGACLQPRNALEQLGSAGTRSVFVAQSDISAETRGPDTAVNTVTDASVQRQSCLMAVMAGVRSESNLRFETWYRKPMRPFHVFATRKSNNLNACALLRAFLQLCEARANIWQIFGLM